MIRSPWYAKCWHSDLHDYVSLVRKVLTLWPSWLGLPGSPSVHTLTFIIIKYPWYSECWHSDRHDLCPLSVDSLTFMIRSPWYSECWLSDRHDLGLLSVDTLTLIFRSPWYAECWYSDLHDKVSLVLRVLTLRPSWLVRPGTQSVDTLAFTSQTYHCYDQTRLDIASFRPDRILEPVMTRIQRRGLSARVQMNLRRRSASAQTFHWSRHSGSSRCISRIEQTLWSTLPPPPRQYGYYQLAPDA